MLTATQAKSIEGTERYFETLNYGDYYTGVEVGAKWHGQLAKPLGIEEGSPVTQDQFKALLRGLHPVTGKKLAQRMRQDRRPGIDLTFSVPKSVSLAWGINQDEAILDALREAVHETMSKDVEPLMCRRDRTGKNTHTQNRLQTGNIVYADFLHKVARPANGKVDMHLHLHAFVMNLTAADGKIFAAEPEEIFRQRQCLQAKFEARLACTLEKQLGYQIVKSEFVQGGRLKAGWEIAGIDRKTCEKFSTRTQQVEEYAQANNIHDPAAKSKLGAKIREKKDKGLSLVQLREQWNERLTPEEQAAFAKLKRRTALLSNEQSETLRAEAAVQYALDHHLYRQSTVERHVIVGSALEQGLTLTPEQIENALDREGILHTSQGTRGVDRHFVTTQEVLDAESRMIDEVRSGRGTRKRIALKEHVFERDWLNEQQKSAVNHVLNSRDSCSAITGGAGTGKSSLMEEAAAAIKANGKELHVFAPSTGAVEVLQEKNFDNARTVEHLLRNKKLHPELRDQVLWIDEAGLLDVRSMNGILAIAKEQNAKVVLSGDSRQHESPRRGAALRILEQEAGLNVARIDEIQRQKGTYKRAVELISLGHQVIDTKTGLTGLVAGFDLLDKCGKIQEITGEERHAVLAKHYMKTRKAQKSALVVSPTHAEGKAVTEFIRTELKKAGAIGKEVREFSQLRSLNMTEAEKSLPSKFTQAGTIIQFHQNAAGFTRGERYRVEHTRDGTPVLRSVQRKEAAKAIPHDVPNRFEVYLEDRIEFAKGDKIRFSLGGTTKDNKRRISNGRLDEVEGFDRQGNLRLKSGMTVDQDYGHWDLGYAITSHASQGKDRDIAIAAIGAQSLAAVNAKQLYVTISRAKEDVALYVDDKAAVRRAIQRAGEQVSATELFKAKAIEHRQAERMRSLRHSRFLDRVRQWWQSHMAERAPAYVQSQTALYRSRSHSNLKKGFDQS
jgi:conjugative relaxase-like TrwC/TraI family protein